MGHVPYDKILTNTIFVWITINVSCLMLAWCGELQLCFLWKLCIGQNVHQVHICSSVYQRIVCGDLLAQIFLLCFHITFNINCIFKENMDQLILWSSWMFILMSFKEEMVLTRQTPMVHRHEACLLIFVEECSGTVDVDT